MNRRCEAGAEQGRREACPNAGEKVYCDPRRGETYKESGVPLKASGVSPCTPVRAAVTPKGKSGNRLGI